MTWWGERQIALSDAIYYYEVSKVKKLIFENPDLDINVVGCFAPLHAIVANGNKELFEIFLSHPEVDVNIRNGNDHTPLMTIEMNTYLEMFLMLLKHPKIDVYCKDSSGNSIFYDICISGCIEGLLWWVALGFKIDFKSDEVKSAYDRMIEYERLRAVLERGKKSSRFYNYPKMRELLNLYRNDKDKAVFESKYRVGNESVLSTVLFSLVVFLCDGFLKVKAEENSETARFFRIASKLPMEIQMILCYRVFRSPKQGMCTTDVDMAVKFCVPEFFVERK